METYFITYLGAINLLSFIMFGIDKMKAEKKGWRIRESTLLMISFLGGAIGSIIGMVVFKHKLSKKEFYLGIPFLIILNKIMELVIFNYIRIK